VPDRYNEFVHRENIALFLTKLTRETDPLKRAMLIILLDQERSHLLPLPKGADT
jgi:hypothetical protein